MNSLNRLNFIGVVVCFFLVPLLCLHSSMACNFNLLSSSVAQDTDRVAVTVALDSGVFEIRDAVAQLHKKYGLEVPVWSSNRLVLHGTIAQSRLLMLFADSNVMSVDLDSDFAWAKAGLQSPVYAQKIDAPLKEAFDRMKNFQEQGNPFLADQFFVMRFVFRLDSKNSEYSLLSFRNLLKKLSNRPGICKVQSSIEPTASTSGEILFQAGTAHARDAILSLPGGPERSRAELVFVGDFPRTPR